MFELSLAKRNLNSKIINKQIVHIEHCQRVKCVCVSACKQKFQRKNRRIINNCGNLNAVNQFTKQSLQCLMHLKSWQRDKMHHQHRQMRLGMAPTAHPLQLMRHAFQCLALYSGNLPKVFNTTVSKMQICTFSHR